jgi:LytS/YehU family sensor histidine kinase
MPPGTEPRHRLAGVVYVAAWLPLVAVETGLFVAQGIPAARAARGAFEVLLVPMLLGLLVPVVVRKADARGAGLPGWLGVHAAALLAFLALSLGGMELFAWIERVVAGTNTRYHPNLLIAAWTSLMNALIYVALAAVAHAREDARRAEAALLRASRAESLRARADLARLRSQLNPHFVMNVLHSLVGLVAREPGRAAVALERLGDLLHYGLRVHRDHLDLVALKEEWAFTTAYLELEAMRLGDRLALEMSADPALMTLTVPSFGLQPLVENAIVHAIAVRPEGGRLRVQAARQGERLILSVVDDGPGLGAPSPGGNGSVGLALIRERLAALYGDRAALVVANGAARGVEARLDLPVRGPEDDDPMPGAGA